MGSYAGIDRDSGRPEDPSQAVRLLETISAPGLSLPSGRMVKTVIWTPLISQRVSSVPLLVTYREMRYAGLGIPRSGFQS